MPRKTSAVGKQPTEICLNTVGNTKSSISRRGRNAKKSDCQEVEEVTSKLKVLDVQDTETMEVDVAKRVKTKRRSSETKTEVNIKTKKVAGRRASRPASDNGADALGTNEIPAPGENGKPGIAKPKIFGQSIHSSISEKENLHGTPVLRNITNSRLISKDSQAKSDTTQRIFIATSECKLESSIQQLKCVFDTICKDPPTPLYRRVCLSLALTLLKSGRSVWETAYYMVESQAVTFRHKALLSWGSRLRKLDKDASKAAMDQREYFTKLRESIYFNKTPRHLQESIQSLPADWTICQLSVSQTPGHKHKHLLVSRFRPCEDPLTVRMEGFSDETRTEELLVKYKDIFEKNMVAVALTDRAQWWKDRYALDEDVKNVLEKIEHHWLGCWKGILQGQLTKPDEKKSLAAAVRKLLLLWKGTPLVADAQAKVELLLLSHQHLSQRDCIQGFLELCTEPNPSADYISCRLRNLQAVASDLATESCTQGPVILVLDKDIQHLPWENLPSLLSQQMTRMPSVYFVSAHYSTLRANHKSVLNQGVALENTYYIVDPDSNLPATKERFQEWFETEEGWQGLVHQTPTSTDFKQGISEHDLFIYCGHGSGAKYLPQDSIEMTKCNAASFLMGCSSGKLVAAGQLEASGTMLHYFMAGGPCMVGCLWDVTDRDIDRYTEGLLKSWLSARGKPLSDAMVAGREACKLRYLTAAAPVVYGLPVHTNKK